MNKNNLRDNRENISKKSGLPSSNSNGSSNNKEYNSTHQTDFILKKKK